MIDIPYTVIVISEFVWESMIFRIWTNHFFKKFVLHFKGAIYKKICHLSNSKSKQTGGSIYVLTYWPCKVSPWKNSETFWENVHYYISIPIFAEEQHRSYVCMLSKKLQLLTSYFSVALRLEAWGNGLAGHCPQVTKSTQQHRQSISPSYVVSLINTKT